MRVPDCITHKPAAENCTVAVHPSVTMDKGEVIFSARNCHLEIAEGCHFSSLKLYFLSDDTRVTIGPGTLCRSSLWANLSGEGRRITIGARCLFASVKLRTSDSHHIIDLDSGTKVNPAEDIVIGDHVWVAEEVLVLKGSIIGAGSAVGARSMVRGEIPPNSLVAGTPAKILRSNIAWRYSGALENPPTSAMIAAEAQVPAPAQASRPAVAAMPSPVKTPLQAPVAALPAELGIYWQKLRRHLAPDLVQRGDRLADPTTMPAEPFWGTGPVARQKTQFLKTLLGDSKSIALKGGDFRFQRHYDLATQLEEIVCNVQYNFDIDTPNPFIVDAGGCYGLVAYWLRRQHPGAEILTFEPNPDNAAIIRANIAEIGMDNVTLEEAAVGVENGPVRFHANATMPMGSSLLPRLSGKGHDITQIEVAQINLPKRIAGRQVDFLKLDVEGAEYPILRALDGHMQGIRRMFIELHFGADLPKSNLSWVLDLLDRNGFDHMITRAGNSAPPHPLRLTHEAWGGSLNLWARAT